jgi:dTMP kinase
MSLFVTFEGIDGTGKSTQIQAAYSWLKGIYNSEWGFNPPILTQEPFSRDLIELFPADRGWQSVLVYTFDRYRHIHEMIEPALQDGHIVLCDRYVDSTIAYQGYGESCLDLVNKSLSLIRLPLPHLTFVFDAQDSQGVSEMMQRVRRRNGGQLIPHHTLDFLMRVNQGYRELIECNPARYVAIDATQSKETIHAIICDRIMETLRQFY